MKNDREAFIAKVKLAGVIGAGGSGFPTDVKLGGRADTVIINGAECEPLLAVDTQLLEQQAEVLVEALGRLVKVLGASTGIIAVKAKHEGAVAHLEEFLMEQDELRLAFLEDFYPVGDEHILVHEVSGRVVPEGGIPLAVGSVVLNVETLLNVTAAQRDQPVVTTYVTVAGEVRKPLTVGVPVGTPISVLLDLAGGTKVTDFRVIDGGPMMGRFLPQEEVASGMAAVQKTTNGVIVLPADHWVAVQPSLSLGVILQRAQSACCQCRLCTDLCPRHLLGHELYPHLVLNSVNHGQVTDPTVYTQAFLCSDCGVCELYACPVELSPRRMYQAIKAEFVKRGFRNPHKQAVSPRAMRKGRQVPTTSLVARLGLEQYNQPAPWCMVEFSPRQVVIALRQHIGVPARAMVKAGDRVEMGQTIAVPPPDALGAAVHASISGRVREVSEEAIVIAGR